MTRRTCARTLSIVGHPAVLMPAAVAWSSAGRGGAQPLLFATAASLLVAVCVGLYCAVQVRAGRWQHIDASVPSERAQLNVFLILLLLVVSALLWASGQPPAIATGLALGGGIVVAAQLLRARLKVSLHAAFAAYAALLLWPELPAMLLGSGLAVAVAWSRLVLGRHTLPEVLLGLALGGGAGAALQCVATGP